MVQAGCINKKNELYFWKSYILEKNLKVRYFLLAETKLTSVPSMAESSIFIRK